jgi:hypothetical protein
MIVVDRELDDSYMNDYCHFSIYAITTGTTSILGHNDDDSTVILDVKPHIEIPSLQERDQHEQDKAL